MEIKCAPELGQFDFRVCFGRRLQVNWMVLLACWKIKQKTAFIFFRLFSPPLCFASPHLKSSMSAHYITSKMYGNALWSMPLLQSFCWWEKRLVHSTDIHFDCTVYLGSDIRRGKKCLANFESVQIIMPIYFLINMIIIDLW